MPSAALLQLAVRDVVQQVELNGGFMPGLFAHLSSGTRPINLISLRTLDPPAVRMLLDELSQIGDRTIERLQVVAVGGWSLPPLVLLAELDTACSSYIRVCCCLLTTALRLPR